MINTKFCKKIWLKHQLKKYERVLLEEGFSQAAQENRDIQLGLEEKLSINKNDNSNDIYLHKNKEGEIDISPILYLGGKKKREEIRRYVVYEKMLKRLEKQR